MRKVLIVLVGLSLLPLPALAQRRGSGEPTAEEIQKQRETAERERQYKAALQQAGSGTQSTAKKDPWANMRAPADSAAAPR